MSPSGTTLSDLDYMAHACLYAVANSDDPLTQNGTLILTSSATLVFGANLIPGTVKHSDDRTGRPLKYQFLEHAERTAICRAAMHGIPL